MTKAGLPAFVVVSRVRYIEGFKDSRVTDVALARLIASFTAYMCPRVGCSHSVKSVDKTGGL